ncbi:DUF2851 family protein [Polaribacter porphyrae]|uniref:DUF2851 domain-containing protein n=1 Tax=Polaribacter porphyrae TaxID=1137780 RepID=A0A2S7WP32_9FLAO|nr:DUF2851 family protein [Polaribacter porphyrae]PQJ79031.1 hypothetical protein BTO18_07540 [Polaribacter porphyrae]
MNEDFLYYIWQYKLFSTTNLQTINHQNIAVLKTGNHNKNEGPDFLNAQLKIDNQLWAGNVEMHVKSSDWYLHKHEEDTNYDAVILHVVWGHDVDVFMKNNQALPTLELQNFVDKNLLDNYKKLLHNKQNWIPCQYQIRAVDNFLIDNWLERLYFERLEQKAKVIDQLLQKSNNDFEAVLFQLLAKNFGLKINGEAFLKFATSIDFSVVRKVSHNKHQLSALLFGLSGFLEDEIEEVYHQQLKKEYQYLQHKYNLTPLSKNYFQFFRMRPHNFPTIRIAQLSALLNNHQNLFSKLIKVKDLNEVYDLFTIEVSEFWKTHFTFENTSKQSSKKLTKSFIDLLVINTIIPLKFVFLKNRGEAFEDDILYLIHQLKPEKNSIISKFSDANVIAKNAMESQALLELKNNYCTKKRCLHCAIGNSLLRSK